jgi:hypothetical protein
MVRLKIMRRSTKEDWMLSQCHISQSRGVCNYIYIAIPSPCCLIGFPGVWRTVGKQDRTTAEEQPPTFSAPHHRSCSVNFRARSTSGSTRYHARYSTAATESRNTTAITRAHSFNWLSILRLVVADISHAEMGRLRALSWIHLNK